MSDPAPNPKRGHRLRWFFGIVFGFFALLAFLFFKDDALDDMSDLAIVDPPPAADGVAAFQAWGAAAALVDTASIRAAHKADPLFRQRRIGVSPWDAAIGDPVIVANRSALTAAIRADALGPFTLPSGAKTFSGGVHNRFHQLGNVLEIFTAEAIAVGDLDNALRVALVHLRMGENLIRQNTSLNTLLKGLSYNRFSIRMLDHISSADPHPQTLDRIDRALAKDPDIYAAYDRACRFEFSKFAGGLDGIAGGEFDAFRQGSSHPPVALFKRNRTQNDGAKFYRALLRSIAQPAAKRSPLPYPQTPGEGLEQYSSNAFGDFVNSCSHFLHGGILEHIDLATAFRNLLRTKIALLRYRRDTGKLPTSLSDLVPTYLDAVPSDPYDGAPLRYDPGRGAVWVLGKDLIDGGGAAATTLSYEFPDPTIYVDPPKS